MPDSLAAAVSASVQAQREASAALLAWQLSRMDDLIASYPEITVQELVFAAYACAEHERPDLVTAFNG